MRRTLLRLGTTNRYTDGSDRKLDGMKIPTDLYLEPISNKAYPARTAHWQPMIAGKPSAFRGNVVVIGAGCAGLLASCLFALRGWHVTTIEQRPPPPPIQDFVPANPRSFPRLVTKRALDSLASAGLQLDAIRPYGRKVCGVLQHPCPISTWLTKGLVELHRYSINLLCIEEDRLERLLVHHSQFLPSHSTKVFYQHRAVAVLPEQNLVALKPLREQKSDPIDSKVTESSKALLDHVVSWERDVEAVTYDLLIGADGVSSTVRSQLGIESLNTQNGFKRKAVTIAGAVLDDEYVHQWYMWFPNRERRERNLGFVSAFPTTTKGTFMLQLYFPSDVIFGDTKELLKLVCADLEYSAIESQGPVEPYPTIFCPQLHDHKHPFPRAVLVGSAAHSCNPILHQDLSVGLEDVSFALTNIDAKTTSVYDAVRMYSRERGYTGDALRQITERYVEYTKRKQFDPIIRMRNTYSHVMHELCPRSINEFYEANPNYIFSRSVENMLNGRGYSSYTQIDTMQYRANGICAIGRLFT